MKLFSIIMLLCLTLQLPLATAGERILVLGDSLSAAYGIDHSKGWVTLLEQRLADEGYRQPVVNASISGETTAGGLARLPRLLIRHQPSIVIIELGANDGLRGLSLKQMRINLTHMIEQSKNIGARVLLLGMHIPPNYGAEYARRFHKIYLDLADAHLLPVVPFFLDGVALHPEYMQDDRLHPNAQGQPILLENVWPQLKPLLFHERQSAVHGSVFRHPAA